MEAFFYSKELGWASCSTTRDLSHACLHTTSFLAAWKTNQRKCYNVRSDSYFLFNFSISSVIFTEKNCTGLTINIVFRSCWPCHFFSWSDSFVWWCPRTEETDFYHWRQVQLIFFLFNYITLYCDCIVILCWLILSCSQNAVVTLWGEFANAFDGVRVLQRSKHEPILWSLSLSLWTSIQVCD